MHWFYNIILSINFKIISFLKYGQQGDKVWVVFQVTRVQTYGLSKLFLRYGRCLVDLLVLLLHSSLNC